VYRANVECDVPEIGWRSAGEVVAAVESMLEVSDGDHSPHAIHELVKHAAIGFVRDRKHEHAFELLSSTRLPFDCADAKLFGVHTALRRYEQKRIARRRRRVTYLLVGVLAYLFCVSPTVFVHLENPQRIAHDLSVLDWSEGLYWSVLTSTTVGYGDIVPYTPYGRMLALFNALLGVLLMGVVAGLILSALSPRRLDS
jgi:hypothetical protein